MKLAVVACLSLALSAVWAQNIPRLRWPVNLPREISGTLGEQRGGHLHSGIDIRTKGRIGYPVFTAAPGTVHSISSSTRGYGKAVVLRHGAIVTQYAHMDGFENKKFELDSLARLLNVLYFDENVANFTFEDARLSFGGGEHIGYSGETGSGPPHLHFTVRVAGGVDNPLRYYDIEDREPPVMARLFVCAEKDGVTVREQAVDIEKVRKGYAPVGRGFFSMNNVFYVSPDEKVFFKLACFDRVGTSNHCALYGIEVFDEREQIFAMNFDAFNWRESSSGMYIYDSSNSLVKDEFVYTYYLCRRNGNKFGRMQDKNGGYLENIASPKKIRVVASDFAGNRSSLEFIISPREARAGENSGESGFTAVKRGRAASVADAAGRCALSVPAGALGADTLLRVDAEKDFSRRREIAGAAEVPERDLFDVFSVYPFDQHYARDVTVSIRRPTGVSPGEARSVMMYHFFRDGLPSPLDTRYNRASDRFEARVRKNGHFMLIRDTTAPQVVLPPVHEFVRDEHYMRKMRFHLFDNLSGVSLRSVRFYIDGERIPYEFEFDRGWAEITLPKRQMTSGLHHLLVTLADRAGNETAYRNLLMFGVQ